METVEKCLVRKGKSNKRSWIADEYIFGEDNIYGAKATSKSSASSGAKKNLVWDSHIYGTFLLHDAERDSCSKKVDGSITDFGAP